MEKISFLKRTGYALVALGLIVLILMTSTQVLSAYLLTLSYLLFAAGFCLLGVCKVVQIIQHLRLGHQKAFCLECGWFGSGQEWLRYRCCPECESGRVDVRR